MQIPERNDNASQDSTLKLNPHRRHLWYDILWSLHRSLRSEDWYHLDDPFPCLRKLRKPHSDAIVN